MGLLLFGQAALHSSVDFIDMTLEEWLRVLDTNLNSVFLCCKAVCPTMRQQGSGRASDLASYITGVVLDINGGYVMP